MREWLKKDPDNIYYLISFYSAMGIAIMLFQGAAGFFD